MSFAKAFRTRLACSSSALDKNHTGHNVAIDISCKYSLEALPEESGIKPCVFLIQQAWWLSFAPQKIAASKVHVTGHQLETFDVDFGTFIQ